MKQRIVVLGAAGFVGAAIINHLDPQSHEVIGITRATCDFSHENASDFIVATVKDGDIVVCAAAKAPAKNLELLTENISLINHIAKGLRGKKLAYILNVSSDAVYGDSMEKLTETSAIEPLSSHGIMHCMREYILERTVTAPIGHIRPTLIYGEDDPHNGYGPNSFVRLAQTGQPIVLFGGGEEQRDHIYIGDVAHIAVAMIAQKTIGVVNAVTGKTISFMEIAQLVQANAPSPIEITNKPRSGPMPHNGYRAFSNMAARKVCPNLQYQDMAAYIQNVLKARTHAVQFA